MISSHHGGSVEEISVCINSLDACKVDDFDSSLKDMGIQSGKCILYYDFKPLESSLLG